MTRRYGVYWYTESLSTTFLLDKYNLHSLTSSRSLFGDSTHSRTTRRSVSRAYIGILSPGSLVWRPSHHCSAFVHEPNNFALNYSPCDLWNHVSFHDWVRSIIRSKCSPNLSRSIEKIHSTYAVLEGYTRIQGLQALIIADQVIQTDKNSSLVITTNIHVVEVHYFSTLHKLVKTMAPNCSEI